MSRKRRLQARAQAKLELQRRAAEPAMRWLGEHLRDAFPDEVWEVPDIDSERVIATLQSLPAKPVRDVKDRPVSGTQSHDTQMFPTSLLPEHAGALTTLAERSPEIAADLSLYAPQLR